MVPSFFSNRPPHQKLLSLLLTLFHRLAGGLHGLHTASCPASHPCLDTFEKHFIRVLNKVYQTIEKNEIRLAEQDRRDTIKLEWQQVALVVDRWVVKAARSFLKDCIIGEGGKEGGHL